MSDQEDNELAEARRIDALVRAAMLQLGIPITNPKSFDELVASGELKAAECLVRSRDMVTPGWSERTGPGSGDRS